MIYNLVGRVDALQWGCRLGRDMDTIHTGLYILEALIESIRTGQDYTHHLINRK